MLSASDKPPPPLAGLVELVWTIDESGSVPCVERVLPSGTTELVFDLEDPERAPLVYGPHSRPFEQLRSARRSLVGIHFAPGGAATLLGVPASEFENSRVGLDSLGGWVAFELGARLAEAPTARTRLRLVESALLARFERIRPPHPAVAYALAELAHDPAPRSIGAIAAGAGLSSRRFSEVFSAQVGLSPKLFARVRRFQRVLELAHARSKPDWMQLAIGCGYYDQAHLARDFGEFAAISPNASLALRSEDPNHLSLAPEGQFRPSASDCGRASLVAGE